MRMDKGTNEKLVLWAAILFVTAGFASVSLAAGADQETRRPYLVRSEDGSLRGPYRVRHDFGRRFSADLTDGEVADLEIRGLEVSPLVLFQPSKPSKCEPWPACRDSGGGGGDGGGDPGDGGGSGRPSLPTDPTPWGIERIYQDPLIAATQGGSGIRVAVLDSGIEASHPDLARRIVECIDFTVTSKSGRSRIKPADCTDSDGHGTLVAGIVAADGGVDTLGLYGVAPESSLLSYRVCGEEGCWSDDVAAAIEYAGKREVQIVSLSLGADQVSVLVQDAVRANSHMLYIAAAGNDGPDVGSIDYPGAHEEVVAVGAMDELWGVPDWSSRGSNDGDGVIVEGDLEIAAPGDRIESTARSGGYEVADGTSFAAPYMAGLAARLWTGDSVGTRAALRSVALDVAAVGDDPETGLGAPVLQDLPDPGDGGDGGGSGGGGDGGGGSGGGGDGGTAPTPNRKLTWTSATGPVATYRVEQRVGNSAWATVGETADLDLLVALSTGVEYQWRVRALSADGAAGEASAASTPYCHECGV